MLTGNRRLSRKLGKKSDTGSHYSSLHLSSDELLDNTIQNALITTSQVRAKIEAHRGSDRYVKVMQNWRADDLPKMGHRNGTKEIEEEIHQTTPYRIGVQRKEPMSSDHTPEGLHSSTGEEHPHSRRAGSIPGLSNLQPRQRGTSKLGASPPLPLKDRPILQNEILFVLGGPRIAHPSHFVRPSHLRADFREFVGTGEAPCPTRARNTKPPRETTATSSNIQGEQECHPLLRWASQATLNEGADGCEELTVGLELLPSQAYNHD